MDPVMLNTVLTYISNYLYCNLKEKDFFNLGLFLSLLSKEMLEMNVIRDLCKWEKEEEEIEREEKKEDKKEEREEKKEKDQRK